MDVEDNMTRNLVIFFYILNWNLIEMNWPRKHIYNICYYISFILFFIRYDIYSCRRMIIVSSRLMYFMGDWEQGCIQSDLCEVGFSQTTVM